MDKETINDYVELLNKQLHAIKQLEINNNELAIALLKIEMVKTMLENEAL
ncbi:MAG: hypothetical protein ACPGSL_10015 [Vicingaceae bacterium]